ncbi:MAG: DNA/RNA helicase domain-containing protein [Ginsengibacter sp.]
MMIVDEAHRLNEKSGLYRNKGENQIKEIINSAKTSVFFIDD